MGISVVINTKNAAETLQRTLESVKGWADEIIIVDMKSTDGTLKIAKKFTKKIFEYEDVGYVEPARNFALSKASEEWVFVLDADEEVPSELKNLVKQVTEGTAVLTQPADAYWIPRKNIVFGKWIEKTGWWPDYQLRLFKNGEVQWSDEVHVPPKVHGKAQFFPAQEDISLIHHNYQTISQFTDRLNRYTSAEVLKTGVGDSEHFTPEAAIQVFTAEFIQRFFVHKGIDEGMHGISLSYLQSMYQLIVLLKRWEKHNFKIMPAEQLKTIRALRQVQRELNYWIADWQIHNSSGLENIWWRVRRLLKI